MGPTPAKVGRIIARDTQTTWPDPWSCKCSAIRVHSLARPGISCCLNVDKIPGQRRVLRKKL